MILYPFQPDLPFGYSVTGFDEEKKTPGAELYLLPPGAQIPAEFTGGAIFSEAPGCADARILQPAQSAAPDAAGVWADTQVSGGSLEGYVRALLARGRAAVDVPAAALHALPGPLPHRRRRSSGPG